MDDTQVAEPVGRINRMLNAAMEARMSKDRQTVANTSLGAPRTMIVDGHTFTVLRLTAKVMVVDPASVRFREQHTVRTNYGGGMKLVVSEWTPRRMTLRHYRKPMTTYAPAAHKPSRKWRTQTGATDGKNEVEAHDEAGQTVHQPAGA